LYKEIPVYDHTPIKITRRVGMLGEKLDSLQNAWPVFKVLYCVQVAVL